jgi:hypothetical protein
MMNIPIKSNPNITGFNINTILRKNLFFLKKYNPKGGLTGVIPPSHRIVVNAYLYVI